MKAERYQPLAELTGLTHAFSLRTEADTKAPGFSDAFLRAHGFTLEAAAQAEQVHGHAVAVVTEPMSQLNTGVDGLVTQVPNLPLVIRCADCAAVFIVDRQRPAIGLLHSGRRGTQANIVNVALTRMRETFGTVASDCRVLISPCIGPCHYEYDLWRVLESQLRAAGVTDVHHLRTCTACHLDRYFSYRAEQGQTGRMFALLALTPV